jgi:hypothetical protein
MLNELERMRKLLSVKKKFYIFHDQYYGKHISEESWHRKVAARTT